MPLLLRKAIIMAKKDTPPKKDPAAKTTKKSPSTAARKKGKSPTAGQIILEAALQVITQSHLQALLLYVDGLDDLAKLDSLDFEGDVRVVLVARSDEAYKAAMKHTRRVVRVPAVRLTRMGQIKMAVMLSFSKRFLMPGDQFVYLTGLRPGQLDTLMVMEVGQEYEIFQSVDEPPLTEHIRRATFERVLNLALELANEGREGKPVGAIFVLGDSSEVIANSQQNIMNPFKGYDENECNILDDRMRETVKEFSSIDGAFVIKGSGVIISAGTYLLPKLVAEALPQGLGARHAAAAAITAATKSVAITISESTGTVRIWRHGRMITEIEKAKRLREDLTNTEE